ncbi:efflux RND transporter periplasmic adaptor subunit [Bacteroidota bacterium]
MKTLYITLITSALLFNSCGSKEAKTQTVTENAIAVTVNKNSMNAPKNQLASSGIIEAIKTATISTRMMGTITKMNVNVGSSVKKGALLLNISNTDLLAKKEQIKSNITAAKAAYASAEKDYLRFQNLYKMNSLSEKEMDDMTLGYQSAKANLNAAEEMQKEIDAQLAYALLKAPFSGKITQKFIEVGNMATPGAPLLTLEDSSSFQVQTTLPESEITAISLTTEVAVLVKSLNKKFTGKILEISNSSKNSGGQYLVKISIPKSPELLSGMYVNVLFETDNAETNKRVFIPKSAIVTQGQLTGVYTVSQSNTALLRWIRLGEINNNTVEVLSGLTQNEKYIIGAEGKLYNGAKITIQ